MSEEAKAQPQTEGNSETNPSTQANKNDVPYDRFAEVNQVKNQFKSENEDLKSQLSKMETAQEELKKSQTSIDEMSQQLSASVDASISRETALRESIMDVLEIRIENSLEQVDLVQTAVSRLMELNLELKAQVKSQSAVIKE